MPLHINKENYKSFTLVLGKVMGKRDDSHNGEHNGEHKKKNWWVRY